MRLQREIEAHLSRNDWDSIAACLADDVQCADRRAGGSTLRGATAYRDVMQAAGLGAGTREAVVVATRGERLGLFRYPHSGAGRGQHAELLSVQEVDAEGRYCAQVLFDSDALDAAIVELDQRDVESGLAGRLSHDVLAAYNAHDFDAWRRCFTPDFAGTDHRPGSLGKFDTEGFIAFTAALFAQVRTQYLMRTWTATIGNVAIGRSFETAETLDDVEISFEAVFIAVVDEVDEKVRRLDFFAPEAESQARAVFEDLVGGGNAP